jgi:photosystem II protein
MAASMISSSALVAPSRAQGLPSLGRRAASFAVVCGTKKKIKTDKPYGACHAYLPVSAS